MTIDMTFERREELIRRDERAEGRAEGRAEETVYYVKKMHMNNISLEQIEQISGLSEAEIREIIKDIKA